LSIIIPLGFTVKIILMAKGAEKDKILEDKNLCQRQALGELD